MLSSNQLRKDVDTLKSRVEAQSKELAVLTETVAHLMDKIREKEDIIAEQEKEIRKWNEGIANIMNYSLEVAKGGNRP